VASVMGDPLFDALTKVRLRFVSVFCSFSSRFLPAEWAMRCACHATPPPHSHASMTRACMVRFPSSSSDSLAQPHLACPRYWEIAQRGWFVPPSPLTCVRGACFTTVCHHSPSCPCCHVRLSSLRLAALLASPVLAPPCRSSSSTVAPSWPRMSSCGVTRGMAATQRPLQPTHLQGTYARARVLPGAIDPNTQPLFESESWLISRSPSDFGTLWSRSHALAWPRCSPLAILFCGVLRLDLALAFASLPRCNRRTVLYLEKYNISDGNWGAGGQGFPYLWQRNTTGGSVGRVAHARAKLGDPPAACTNDVHHMDTVGATIDTATDVESWEDCAALCCANPACGVYTYVNGSTASNYKACYLRDMYAAPIHLLFAFASRVTGFTRQREELDLPSSPSSAHHIQ